MTNDRAFGTAIALFDFDGTITSHETMPQFVRQSVSRGRLLFGQLVLAPLVIGYKLGLVSGTRVRSAVVRFGYRGVTVTALESAGRAFARDVLPTVLREQAMQRIAWHRAQGHQVVVVSGGLDVYLAPWCEANGLELICSSLQSRNGVLTGLYAGRQCVLDEKVRRLRERYDLGAYSTIYAYGDTPEDRDLLAIANRPSYRWQEIPAEWASTTIHQVFPGVEASWETEIKDQLADQCCRNRIIDMLEWLIKCEHRAPLIGLVGLINFWEDWVPSPFIAYYLPPVFTWTEQDLLRRTSHAIDAFWNAAQQLTDVQTDTAALQLPQWSNVITAAKAALSVMMERGRMPDDVELQF